MGTRTLLAAVLFLLSVTTLGYSLNSTQLSEINTMANMTNTSNETWIDFFQGLEDKYTKNQTEVLVDNISFAPIKNNLSLIISNFSYRLDKAEGGLGKSIIDAINKAANSTNLTDLLVGVEEWKNDLDRYFRAQNNDTRGFAERKANETAIASQTFAFNSEKNSREYIDVKQNQLLFAFFIFSGATLGAAEWRRRKKHFVQLKKDYTTLEELDMKKLRGRRGNIWDTHVDLQETLKNDPHEVQKAVHKAVDGGFVVTEEDLEKCIRGERAFFLGTADERDKKTYAKLLNFGIKIKHNILRQDKIKEQTLSKSKSKSKIKKGENKDEGKDEGKPSTGRRGNKDNNVVPKKKQHRR